MDLRQLTPTFFASPQLDPADFPAVREAGFAAVICNRPDAEVPPSHQAEAMRQAAEAAGLAFHVLPLTHQTMTPQNAVRQHDLAAATAGAVLAYCASGTRSTMAWALGQAGQMPVEEILARARAAGYDIAQLRPALESLAKG